MSRTHSPRFHYNSLYHRDEFHGNYKARTRAKIPMNLRVRFACRREIRTLTSITPCCRWHFFFTLVLSTQRGTRYEIFGCSLDYSKAPDSVFLPLFLPLVPSFLGQLRLRQRGKQVERYRCSCFRPTWKSKGQIK